MSLETLLEEQDLLLDFGEPLLDVCPTKYKYSWLLQLPDNISVDMWRYANAVAYRAWDSETFHRAQRQYSSEQLETKVRYLAAGLLGWRAIGVL